MDEKKILEELKLSFEEILFYSGISGEDLINARKVMAEFKALKDKTSTEEDARRIRLAVTKMFYFIYKKAFFESVEDDNVPVILKMFFNFGFMDVELAGEENTIFIYKLASIIRPDEKRHIYFIYDWLLSIYKGEKSPSINEMSLDYDLSLRELKKEGKLTDSDIEKLQSNTKKKVEFEIDNAFKSMNRAVSGVISTFVPVFIKESLYKPLDKAIISYRDIYSELDKIIETDYSLFYREVLYTNPAIGVDRLFAQKEVLPDIILMPTAGSRGLMWQEIAGKNRSTSARFALPFFMNGDLSKVFVKICGEFRWEMCKRVQGARWNDLSDPSLTADYCDYIETMKKNRELSQEQREKLKQEYVKHRKNTREMFTADYSDYILYESTGSMRLNKVSRKILFRYCPFSSSVREVVSKNTIYGELLTAHNFKVSKTAKVIDNIINRIVNNGNAVPKEIQSYKEFLCK